MSNQQGQQGGPGADKDLGNAGSVLKFELDGQEHQLTAEEAKALVQERATVTKKGQQAAAVFKAAEKYNLSPEDLIEQAEGAFDRVAELVRQGILDEEGNVVVKSQEPGAPGDKPRVTPSAEPDRWSRHDDIPEDRFTKTVEKVLGPLSKRLDMIEEDQARLVRMKVEGDLIAKHPELDTEDVARLFARARMDREKSIWKHAEDLVNVKREQTRKIEANLAKELGIDLESYRERNKLREQDAQGIAGGIVGKKKLSFRKGDGKISPGQAFAEFLRRKQELGKAGG